MKSCGQLTESLTCSNNCENNFTNWEKNLKITKPFQHPMTLPSFQYSDTIHDDKHHSKNLFFFFLIAQSAWHTFRLLRLFSVVF